MADRVSNKNGWEYVSSYFIFKENSTIFYLTKSQNKTVKAEQMIVAQRMNSSTSYHILHSVFDVHRPSVA